MILTRLGYAARGVLYLLIGIVALQIAFGSGGEADKSGAIRIVAEQPFGVVVLWIMTVGLAALTVWQARETLSGRGRTRDRIESALRALFYALLVVSLLGLLLRGKPAASTDSQSQDATKALLDLPGGQVLVGIAALGLVALGAHWIHEGWTKKFMKDMTGGGETVRRLGQAGYIARGVIAIAAGVLVGQAAITYDAGKAVGIDGALKSLADTPAGPWLLAAVAMGLVLFAMYCVAEARWHRA
ncbi:DUF1206 domain-containing protein [Nonomuraea africana]|uniref:Membrane protein YphA (DoxX/SURF4 family) n=1 Tax=Nonomuraea africana TaxID=46171 RepID=A0ABR9KGR2_9ACTN|nr:DUF1206 domain-containing protein [Nonomuraea africana]MBE1561175.1 putative membrane protein YphA (DoxX/SURF4 family) [Nonomuraea africana]